jgi:UDP-N-acetyl-D-galactosamine dehydrogenase
MIEASDAGEASAPSFADAGIAVIGLGYVGLPLAVEFGKIRQTIGFDIDSARIEELNRGYDRTLEVEAAELGEAMRLSFSHDSNAIRDCRIFIVTVPTPIDQHKRPDLTALLRASELIGSVMPRGALVIYESTVYPGATEEDCVPTLEKASGMRFNRDFFVGYSPERINPGDKSHRLATIVKVTSGSTPAIADEVDRLYGQIVTAGTHKAPSIRVAEAAKVIENTQRDLNIALVNELALIFARMNIDTIDVLEAAATKWNFLPFRPGLVGGHCIGVDPYYLTHKAQALGYHPEVVLAGRRINDGMGTYVATRLVREMIVRGIPIKNSRVLILGLTFKENCPDLRNTRVVDVIEELRGYGIQVDANDPWASKGEAMHEYGIALVEPEPAAYDAIILAVAHSDYRQMGFDRIRALAKGASAPLFDLKGILAERGDTIRL